MEILCTEQLQRIARIFELGCSVHHQWQNESEKREQRMFKRSKDVSYSLSSTPNEAALIAKRLGNPQ